MTEWRKIHRVISTSKSWNNLLNNPHCGELAQLIFILLIIHSDDYGRITGNTKQLKMLIYPGSGRAILEINQCLELMEKYNLIIWDRSLEVVQIIKWEIYQPIGHRRKNSKYPAIFKDNGKVNESKELFSVEENEKVSESTTKESGKVAIDKNRIEENRIDKKRRDKNIYKHGAEKSAPVQSIVFLNNKWANIKEEDIKDWSETYPACDIEMELKKMKQWILSNPAKGKKKNYRRFITNWLSRTQDKGGTRNRINDQSELQKMIEQEEQNERGDISKRT